MILSVDKRNYSYNIQECSTPKDIWKKLTETFEDGGLIRKVSLLQFLISTKLNECKNVEEYVNKISNSTSVKENRLHRSGRDDRCLDVWSPRRIHQ